MFRLCLAASLNRFNAFSCIEVLAYASTHMDDYPLICERIGLQARFNVPLLWEQRVLDWPSCGDCAANFYFSEVAFGSNAFHGSCQFRHLPIALDSAPDLGSGQVQVAVVSESEKLACLHGQGVLRRGIGWPSAGSSRHSLVVLVGCAPINNIQVELLGCVCALKA